MIAALRTTLALVLAVLVCWSVPTPGATAERPRASAAECEKLDLNDAAMVVARADEVTDVFAGTVRAVERRTYVGGGEGKTDQTDGPGTDPRQIRYQQTVQVEVSFRGAREPGERVMVVTDPINDGGLGRLADGAMYLFFVDGGEGGSERLVAEPCSGTQLLMGGLGATQRNALHRILDESAGEEPALDYMLSAPDGGARSTPSLGRLAAPGAAVALFGILGLMLLSRVGSRRN